MSSRMIQVEKGKVRVGILAGGDSSEREVSLRSGNNIMAALNKKGYNLVQLCDTDAEGLRKIFNHEFDIIFNILHGVNGEDGTIQGFLETLNVPYTGSGILSSSVCMNKVVSKKILRESDIPTPEFLHINKYMDIDSGVIESIKQNLGLPCVIKPTSEGSSVGVRIIKDINQLESNLIEIKNQFKDIFVEKFISGPNITVGVIEKFGEIIALPILELVPKNDFYDYEAKYTEGMTEFIIPARLPEEIYFLTTEIAMNVFKIFECSDFARIDFIVERKRLPYVHEINTLPGMTNLSDLPAEAENAGISYEDLVEQILLNGIWRNENSK
ncbi:D-alanine--D-alanine ligase [Candidatus Dependentiae bacterium]|nr:D-alanine--D-alanine ligase [Candidatus Dependentiae bacterium]